MADVTETYTLNFETNAQKATGLVGELEKTLSSMGNTGELSAKGLNSASRSILNIEKALGGSAGAVKKYSDSFSNLRKEVSEATKALQEAAQSYVVGGGTDVLGAASQTMNLDEAKEVLAIRRAEGLTAEQVAAEVVAASKRKEAAEEAYATAMRQGMQRLEQIQKSQTDSENAESLRVHNLKMARLQEEVQRETAAVQKILAERQKLNSANAKAYQSAYTDPKSFFGQANSRDASTGLKASETSWAVQAKQQQAFRNELNRTEVAFQEQSRAAELAALRQQILARNTQEAVVATKEHAASLPTLRYALYDVAQTAGMMSAAIGAAGAGALTLAAQYESSFTAVERTSGVTGDAVAGLREEFLQLAREIPQSFSAIADIGARGAQLGVASDSLADFTETVAQFVATSDTVTLDQAVEAFGRISNLLGDTDFNAIGSAITKVGVNAAATEAQIVKTTQELAPFATAVGMTSDEVIGLASSLASLGQPPERARSAFLTLQRVMDTAVASGSENLQQFANLLGITSDEVATLWKQDPSQFTASFARALGSVEDLTTTFSALGINERRAVQVFQALAADARNAGEGLSVLERGLADSSSGYEEGTELAKQYALIVDDLASKWQLFVNALSEFGATVGGVLAPAAGAFLETATDILNTLSEFASSPAGKWVVGVAAAFGALAFAVTGVIATMALAGASLAAMGTAVGQLNLQAGMSIFSIRGLNAALTQTATAAGVSTAALSRFKVGLAGTGIGLAVLALGALAAAFMQAGESAEETFNRFVTSSGGLANALAADAEAFAAGASGSFTTVISKTQEMASVNEEAAQTVKTAAEVLGVDLKDSLDAVTSAAERQTTVIGSNTVAWLQNSLMQSEAFQKLVQDADFVQAWSDLGADFSTVVQIAASEGEQGVLNYFSRLASASENGANAYLSGLNLFMHRIGESFRIIGQIISDAWSGIGSALSNPDNWFGGSPGLALSNALTSSVFKSFDSLRSIWSEPVFKDGFRDIANLSSGMVGLARETSAAGAAVAESADDLDGWGDSADDAAGSAGNLQREVRTLLDYASDLSKVWNRAFDIRFSGQSTLDTITSSFNSIREAAADAAKRIRDLKNDMQSLQSDINIQEYFLSIAIEYGDTKRAAAIEADLAKKRAELADKSADLQKEQEKTNKSLVGNSQAAIDNRKQITDLVKQYQSHIEALAASGMSQGELSRATERLKRDFINQATQLGFNRAELGRFAAAFDDVSVAIKNIPPINISVSGLSPAQIALKEMETSIKNLRNSVGSGINVPVSTSLDTGSAARAARLVELQSQLANAQNQLNKAIQSGADNRASSWLSEVSRLKNIINSGSYASGGFTGTGGMYEPAGIVHRGEYIFRKDQVNQSTGLPKEAALLSMMGSLPSRTVAPAGSAGFGGAQQVTLSPGSIQALAQAVQPYLVIDGRLVAEASSSSYAKDNSVGAY